MSEIIKITNTSGHKHGVRLLTPMGGYGSRELAPNQFMGVTEEQFLDIYNSTRDFSCGYLSFDKSTLTPNLVNWLGFATVEEIDFGIISYTDTEIKDILKGSIGKFNSFLKEVRQLDPNKSATFKKRLFGLADSMPNELTQNKASEIEEVTGISFALNTDFKNSK
jgi:hypothetical protein